MIIGLPREIKNHEGRVGLTPANIFSLVEAGHQVLVEAGAGEGSSITDEDYLKAGGQITANVADVWAADLVVKVKEPQVEEYQYLHPGLILITYLHLASDDNLVQALVEKGVIALGYETMELDGKLPLLAPMSAVAGRYAPQIAAHYLEKINGGKGILLGGVPGTRSARFLIIGGGEVGLHAATIADGLGAKVTILDNNPTRLSELANIFGNRIETVMSNPYNIEKLVKESDVVVGSVLLAGRRAPVLVTEEMVKQMEAGSVLIDIAIDQGGNFETSDHSTNHDEPIYIKYGVIHYAVGNIPGAVPNTATYALTNATMRYIQKIADLGIEEAARQDHTIATGINTYHGYLTNNDVAATSAISYTDLFEVIK